MFSAFTSSFCNYIVLWMRTHTEQCFPLRSSPYARKLIKIDTKNILICELYAPGYGLPLQYSSC